MGKRKIDWLGWWPERLAATLAMGGLTYSILSGFHARTWEGDATDFKTLYASTWCFAHHIDPYEYPHLQHVFVLNHVVPPGSWFAHSPIYPFFTLALLTPLTALPMIQAVYVWILFSVVLLTCAAAALARVAGGTYGLSLPWRLGIIASFAALPLVSAGLEVTNVSLVVSAVCILVAMNYGRANLWLSASAMTFALLLKPHIAFWMLLALLLGGEPKARGVATRAIALAAGAVALIALAMALSHQLIPQLAAYRAMLHAELTTGSMAATTRESLLVPAQISSLAYLLGFWLDLVGAQILSLLMLAAAGLALLRLSLRRARLGVPLSTENIAAWCAFGMIATYHRAADAVVLLILLPLLAARLRAARDSIFAWSVIACFFIISVTPAPEFFTWLTGLAGSPEPSSILFFRQAPLGFQLLLLVLLGDQLRRPSPPGALEAAPLPTLIDRHPGAAFAVLSVFYFLIAAGLSSVKLLWLDELITLDVARLGSVPAIWGALAAGADPNPPLIHICVMLCRRIFGEHAWALRLPAMLGYWVGMLALFLFLKRRIPAVWALTAIVLSMGMGGFQWSFESRSYGLFYGLAMLALFCWSRLAEAGASPRARSVALAGLTFSLAAGISTNYFGVLAFFPVAAAELTRTLHAGRQAGQPPAASRARAFDWPVWGALAVAATPLLLFRPLIQKSVALYQPYAWNKVSLPIALHAYADMIEWVRYPLVALLALAVVTGLLAKLCVHCRARIYPRWLGRLAEGQSGTLDQKTLRPGETTAVWMLLAYPLLGYAVATLRGGMLASRFVIPVCFGAAIAGTVLAFRTFRHLRAAGTVALGVCLLWFALRQSSAGFNYEVEKESFDRVLQSIPPPEYPRQPLVVGDNILVLPLQYYAPPAIASRIVYPIDFAGVMDIRREASAEMNLWAGRGLLYPFPITPLATLQQSTSTYIILTGRDWLVDDLRRHRYRVDDLPIDTHAPGLDLWPTPLAHGKPELFRASGELDPDASADSIPFSLAANLPKAP